MSILALPRRGRRTARSLDVPDQLKAIRRRLRQLFECLNSKVTIEVAVAKFKTTGDEAAPLSRQEAAFILSRTPAGLAMLTARGELPMRWPEACMYHPDDLRAFLKTRKTHRSMRERRLAEEARSA